MTPPEIVQKVLDTAAFFADLLPSPLSIPANPPDPAAVQLQEALQRIEALNRQVKEILEARQNLFFGGLEGLTQKLRKNPELILLPAVPVVLPFLMAAREMNPSYSFQDFIRDSFFVKGIQEFLAEAESSREERLQCLASEDNRNASEISAEKIKTLITSKNSSLFSMENVDVRLEDGRIHITGTADFPGPDYQLDLVIRISGRNGNIKGEVETLTLDGEPINETLLGILLDQMRSQGIKMPQKPDLKDLSWVEIPELYVLEVKDGKIVMEFSKC